MSLFLSSSTSHVLLIISFFISATSNINTTLPTTTLVIPESTELFTSSQSADPCPDISPNPDNTCLDFYRWNTCEQDWMQGHCCGTCGYASCLDTCYDNDIANIPDKYYPNPFDCASDEPPPPGPDGVQSSCIDQKSWGNCGQGWMFGFCCTSCPEDCWCPINNSTTNITIPTQPVVTTFYNHTNSQNNCQNDIPPPPGPDGKIPSCLDQYRWGNCEQDWMDSYCCQTCGFTGQCLDKCYDNDTANIPSRYYPLPFDCESNEFLSSDDDSCYDEASWGNCDQSWMFGWCCVSCPEACGCEDYKWNNTAYLASRPSVIVTLSFEEIKFYERLFISLHTLLLLIVFIAPILLCYRYCVSSITADILHKMASMTQISQQHSHNEPDLGSVSTSGEGKSVSTPDIVSSDEELSASSPPSTQKGPRGITWKREKSVRSMRSVRSGTSHSRRSTYNADDEEAKKIYDFYKLLAVLCIILWSLTILLQIITLILWHGQENDDFLRENSKEWDTARMLIYVISKMLMYLNFILRVYWSFQHSAYSYSIWFIGFLCVMLLIDTITKMVTFIMMINDLSGNIVDKNIAKYEGNDSVLFYALIFLVIEEIFFTLILVIAFVRPLVVISKKTRKLSVNAPMFETIVKYLILGVWCIVSSAIIDIFRIFYISTSDLLIIWITALMESFDCCINAWCTILLFSSTTVWYNKLCGCSKKCVNCCYTHFIANKNRKNSKNDIKNNGDIELE